MSEDRDQTWQMEHGLGTLMYSVDYMEAAASYQELRMKFGRWENPDEPGEVLPLNWLMIAETDEMYLLHLSYGIRMMAYDADRHKVKWESSSICEWLNTEFYEKAFSAEEKQRILQVDHNNYRNITAPEPELYLTHEKVFLLGEEDVRNASHSESDFWVRGLIPDMIPYSSSPWWLRSYGRLEGLSMGVVRHDGIIYSSGDIRADNVMVVPAIFLRKE